LQNYSNSRTHPKEEEEVGGCASRLLNFKMMELLKKLNSFGKEKKRKKPPTRSPSPKKTNASSRNVWILGRLSFFHIF
jgi:hypothetical protein